MNERCVRLKGTYQESINMFLSESKASLRKNYALCEMDPSCRNFSGRLEPYQLSTYDKFLWISIAPVRTLLYLHVSNTMLPSSTYTHQKYSKHFSLSHQKTTKQKTATDIIALPKLQILNLIIKRGISRRSFIYFLNLSLRSLLLQLS